MRSMSMSEFMDKQIMDLSKSNTNDDAFDRVDPRESGTKKEEIDPAFNFESIRPTGVELDRDGHNNTGVRVWKSADSITAEIAAGIGVKNYGSLGSTGPSKFTTDKEHIDHNAALTLEIEGIMKRHTDSLMHALDGLSARLSQFESRSRHIETSVDDLKLCIGNNHGIVDGRLRQIENVLKEVQSNVQDIKDKQDVMDAHIQLSIMQISKTKQQQYSQPETAAAAAIPTLPQLPLPAAVPQTDPYLLPPPPMLMAPPQDAVIPQYQLPPQQHLQPPMLIAPPQQQYHQPQPQEPPYPPPLQTYHSSLQQQPPLPTKPPTGAPFQPFYGSGFPNSYNPSSGNGDSYPYHQYGHGDFSKQQVSAPPPSSSYNQLPTARILPKPLPTASPVSDGGSSSGNGNRVPVDDVVDKVTTMGFPRDQVRAIVRKLTENGQSVDLNSVLDKLMNDGGVGGGGGWYGRR